MIREQIRKIIEQSVGVTRALHTAHVNPKFVEALGLLGYGRDFVRAEGTRLWDGAGIEYLDFLASYGAVPLGHNHPEVCDAIDEALRSRSPNFMQVAPQPLAAALAARLSRIAPAGLSMTYLMSSGSEAVDGALKLARAATRRERFVSAHGGYHGTTFGALSVTSGRRARSPFEPLLPGCALVPFGDLAAIERELRKRDVAAVILEPIQAEGGIVVPPRGYLADVARICRRYGTLLVLDEVQTGLGRTGAMFACTGSDPAEPDVLVIGKALSGGLAPISAYMTRPDIWKKAYGTLDRFDAHCSTYSGSPLASAAALATIEIIERDRLSSHAEALGELLGERLRAVTRGHALVREVRGRGLLWGIEFRAPGGGVAADLIGGLFAVAMIERRVVTQVTVHAPAVLRAEPPLTVDAADVDRFIDALGAALAQYAGGPLSTVGSALKTLAARRIGAFTGGTWS